MADGLFHALDLAGVAVFAASGALVASRKEMDLIGFGLMATLTGIGGGTLRDLLLGRTVFWIADQSTLVVCLAIAAAGFFFAPSIQRRYHALLWADAVGLAFFAVLGAKIALAAGAQPLPAVVLGMMTATFGGLARDVIAGETPLLLRPEIYATAALVASALFTGLAFAGVASGLAAAIAIAAGFALRAGAILKGWQLPRYRARPGRDW